jgi:hypothetical protein
MFGNRHRCDAGKPSVMRVTMLGTKNTYTASARPRGTEVLSWGGECGAVAWRTEWELEVGLWLTPIAV